MDINKIRLEGLLVSMEYLMDMNREEERSKNKVQRIDAHARAFAYGLAAKSIKKILKEWDAEDRV